MAVKIGHASISETGGVNGVKGDSTGKEVCTRDWYDKDWDFMAIHPDATVREKHAQAVEDACGNDNIGYGQSDRNTAYAQYVIYKTIKAIKTKCNTDCSALQNLAALASGAAGVTYGSNGWTTSTMRAALKKAGYKIITDSTLLKNAAYCVRGAVYVKEGKHTVCGLTDGTKASTTLSKCGISAKSSKKTESSTKKTSASTKIESAESYDKSLAGKYIVTASTLNIRSGAGTTKTDLGDIPKGKTVTCYGYYTTASGTKWLLVVYGDITGFVSSKYLKKK